MSTYTSAAELVKRVGKFAQSTPTWAECIVYESKPDERLDMTDVSQRVYGTRDEFLAVMAAAGLDAPWQVLTERRIILPTARQLAAIKAACGFVTNPLGRTSAQAADPIGTR